MHNKYHDILKRHGFSNAGTVSVKEFVFHKSFYEICATNQCGKYNTNWSCPPGVGEYEDLVVRLKAFEQALVVQSVWTIADSFDIEGMLESGLKHNAMLRALTDELYPLLGFGARVTLSAGACGLCQECSYLRGQSCPMPERAFGSLEAHGVDVGALLGSCELKYNNGPNTVSYVGVILSDAFASNS
ncbi:MAG: DUF2284 domain-containing protein [Kiritimatiellae bacterium]|nr:DUF2284 domain-containing protein [Kiritimatiellia bacterium]